MNVYIVTKNEQPCLTTLDEREACALYEDLLHSGRYRQAAVLFVPANTDNRKVLLEAFEAG